MFVHDFIRTNMSIKQLHIDAINFQIEARYNLGVRRFIKVSHVGTVSQGS